jgi:glycosyltransferase involved in cell wall biosynthesis
MNVLIVHSQYRSGPVSGENRVVEDEAELLRRSGHRVEVLSPEPVGQGALDVIRAGQNAVWSQRMTSKVRRIVRRSRIEVVHCHNLFPSVSPAVLRAAEDEGATVVVTLHNYRLLCLPATLVRDGRTCEDCVGRAPWPGVLHACYRGSRPASLPIAFSLGLHRALGTFERVHGYLAVSRFVGEKHVQAGFPAARIRVKPNFVWPTERREGPGDRFVFLGRLAPEKGVDTLLAAWEGVQADLLIVGDGPQASQLRRTAPPEVTFQGAVAPDEVPRLLRGARALVLPSIGYEAQPRSVLEAYAAGVPVVASRIGAVEEIVRDGETGVLVPPGNPGSWAGAVERLMSDQEAIRLGQGAWARWREYHSPDRAIEDLMEAYRCAQEIRRDERRRASGERSRGRYHVSVPLSEGPGPGSAG